MNLKELKVLSTLPIELQIRRSYCSPIFEDDQQKTSETRFPSNRKVAWFVVVVISTFHRWRHNAD